MFCYWEKADIRLWSDYSKTMVRIDIKPLFLPEKDLLDQISFSHLLLQLPIIEKLTFEIDIDHASIKQLCID